ncbi:hypothetical protein ACN28E_06645 [Archangium lansingense]|uniref:hypothetical protein n=1 Tax=Archangium lansingense TaxID=2995310 RepID=UPI003B7A0055
MDHIKAIKDYASASVSTEFLLERADHKKPRADGKKLKGLNRFEKKSASALVSMIEIGPSRDEKTLPEHVAEHVASALGPTFPWEVQRLVTGYALHACPGCGCNPEDMNLLAEAVIRQEKPRSAAEIGSSYAHSVIPQSRIKHHTWEAIVNFYTAIQTYRQKKKRRPLVDAKVDGLDVLKEVNTILGNLKTEDDFLSRCKTLEKDFLRLMIKHTTFYIDDDDKGADSKEVMSMGSGPNLAELTKQAKKLLDPGHGPIKWGGIGAGCFLCEQLQGEGSLMGRWEVSQRLPSEKLRQLYVGKDLVAELTRGRLNVRMLAAKHIHSAILPHIKPLVEDARNDEPNDMFFVVTKLWPLFEFYYILRMLQKCQNADEPSRLRLNLEKVVKRFSVILIRRNLLSPADITWADSKGSASSGTP